MCVVALQVVALAVPVCLRTCLVDSLGFLGWEEVAVVVATEGGEGRTPFIPLGLYFSITFSVHAILHCPSFCTGSQKITGDKSVCVCVCNCFPAYIIIYYRPLLLIYMQGATDRH